MASRVKKFSHTISISKISLSHFKILSVFILCITASLSHYGSSSKAFGNSCNLSGKSIVIDIVLCPERNLRINSTCVRSRQRFSVLGNKVLFYADEITPEGTIFYIGKRIEISNDEEQRRFVFGKDFPGVYQRAWVTASYSAGQLRLQIEHNRYLIQGGLFQRNNNSYIINIPSCNICVVDHLIHSSVTGFGSRQKREVHLLRKQSCQLKEGI